MRIVVFGQQAFGKDVFDSLVAAGEEVVGVSTPKPREGRTDPLAEAAKEKNIPNVFTRELRKDEGFDEYLSWKPDLLVFAFVTDIVRQNVLDAATHGAIQYHPSLLPLHRGRAAMNWAILAGREETGLTIFWVDEGIDTGPVILQKKTNIGENDTVGSIYFNELYPMGVEALTEAVGLVRSGKAERVVQDESLATYEGPCEDSHGILNFSAHGQIVHNTIRGCEPQPGASAQLNDTNLKLFGSVYSPGGGVNDEPGTIIDIIDGAALVSTIGGTIKISRVQRLGEKKVAAGDVLKIGDVLS
jgi:methionyl-tRNA formyltransferase